MDIEGAEWRVLLNASDKVLRRFRIIVVELHNMEKIAIDSMNSIVSSVLKRLFEISTSCMSPNRVEPVLVRGIRIPRVIEIHCCEKTDALRSALCGHCRTRWIGRTGPPGPTSRFPQSYSPALSLKGLQDSRTTGLTRRIRDVITSVGLETASDIRAADARPRRDALDCLSMAAKGASLIGWSRVSWRLGEPRKVNETERERLCRVSRNQIGKGLSIRGGVAWEARHTPWRNSAKTWTRRRA